MIQHAICISLQSRKDKQYRHLLHIPGGGDMKMYANRSISQRGVSTISHDSVSRKKPGGFSQGFRFIIFETTRQ